MKKKRLLVIVFMLLALAGLTAVGTMAAGGAGSQSDPLVTLSYLTDTFTDQVMEKVDKLIAERNTKLASELGGGVSGTSSGYTTVTLAAGQTLTGEAGCEVLLRTGVAVCTASSVPGLADTTTGSSINNGAALQQNHLYLMTDSRGVFSAAGATLLVRGGYTIG